MKRWDCMLTHVVDDDGTKRLFPTYRIGTEPIVVVVHDGEEVDIDDVFSMIEENGSEVIIGGRTKKG